MAGKVVVVAIMLSLTAALAAPVAQSQGGISFTFNKSTLVWRDMETMHQTVAYSQMNDGVSLRRLESEKRIARVGVGTEGLIVGDAPHPDLLAVIVKGLPGRWLAVCDHMDTK